MAWDQESRESVIGSAEGVARDRGFRSEPEEGGRWSNDIIDGFNGAPWEPYPGAGGGLAIESRVRLPVDNEKITFNIEGKDEHAPRRVRIARKDLEKFGLTVGCAGRRLADRGATAVGHTENSRKRIIEEL